MSTGATGYPILISYPIDPNIIENKDVINEIRKLFPVDDKDEGQYYMYLLTDVKHGNIAINIAANYIMLRMSNTKRCLSLPATRYSGLSRKSVELFWDLISLLEEYGWKFDQKENWGDWGTDDEGRPTATYDYPLPENRAKFIQLLKKVYTMPMTKRALA